MTKCVWQNVNTKSAHGVKPMCTHLGCHAVEDFPCTNLLVGSMTWTWSSWDRHRTGCTDGIAVSAMAVDASPRPKLTTTVRAFEAQ